MSNTLKSFRTWLHQGNHSTWILFVSFAILLFIKCILFHWAAFHSILVSSLWKAPLNFYKFYMAKLLMSLLIASFLFISKRRWWTIIISFLVDIWCISNLIYYKTYDAFLTVNDMLLIGNMQGAWSSVTAYVDWTMVVMLLLTIFWSCICIPLSITTHKRQWKVFIIVIMTTYALAILNNYLIYNHKFWADEETIGDLQKKNEEDEEWIKFVNEHGGHERQLDYKRDYIPFYKVFYQASQDMTTITAIFTEHYIREQSIIADFVAVNINYLFGKEIKGEIIKLTPTDIAMIEPFIHSDSLQCSPQHSLIVILVESLEDWPLQKDIEDINIAPNLRSLVTKDHILYCAKITSQTLGGNSGDGQMIINSGMLPTQNSVACMCYGNNVYPNIAHFYDNSALVNPWPVIWNQDTMSVRYGFKEKIEPKSSQWEDAAVFDHSLDYLEHSDMPTCLLTITVSTHAPFNRIRNPKIKTSSSSILDRYLKSFNYTDSCIGAFMNKVLADPELSQSTIVITGDHTIFKSAMLMEFKDYATAQNLSIANGENYCPLIIYSPQIEGNIHISDICYQMDIFPTILHLIGCDDYYWHGFGVNLLDEKARHNRPVTEQEAYRISDLMIRSDYFRQYLRKD